MIPPLLNDFIGLQKDTALVSVLGAVDALQQANIQLGGRLQLHAVRGRGRSSSSLITIPLARFTDWLVARERRRRQAGGLGVSAAAAALASRACTSASARPRCCAASTCQVAEHEVVCLIGASGSGKSTLLRCINLLEPVDAGRISVDGDEITAAGVDVEPGAAGDRDRVPGVQPVPAHDRAAKRDARRRARRSACRGGRPRRQARALLERFGLADKVLEYPDRLSGGQQQRVAIVRALAMQPRLMLLDEVTSALDPELVAEVLEVIRELAEQGMTMIIATHEMGFARDIANRVCFLHDGVILEQGPPDQIFSEPEHERTRQFLQRIIAAGRM